MRTRALFIELLEVVALAAILFVIIHVAIEPVTVSGPSMHPTVVNNNYLIALRFPYYFGSPGRGDVVILKSPYDSSTDLIKRVVALPGETVLIKSGTVYIDGKILCEPYLRPGVDGAWTVNTNWPADARPFHLSSTQYFVMGDNRNVSEDSRIFGPVQRSSIVAQAWLRIYPFNSFGAVDPQRGRLTDSSTAASAGCTTALAGSP